MYLATHRHFKNRNNKFDIAINTFPKTAKTSETVHNVYKTGFHKSEDSMGCITYSLVIYCFRIMIYYYKKEIGDCQ